MSDLQLPVDWVATIRMWAVDQPAIRKISAVWTSKEGMCEPSELRLRLTTTADGYGNVLAPFIERRAAWAAALKAKLNVPIELEHTSFAQVIQHAVPTRSYDIWSSGYGNDFKATEHAESPA